jgi:replicative DNA helicase
VSNGGAELLLLRALCRTETSGTLRGTILTALAAHRFAEPEHDVVFEALRDIQNVGRVATEQRVAEMLLRRGFPDLDLGEYFAAGSDPITLTEISGALRAIGHGN